MRNCVQFKSIKFLFCSVLLSDEALLAYVGLLKASVLFNKRFLLNLALKCLRFSHEPFSLFQVIKSDLGFLMWYVCMYVCE